MSKTFAERGIVLFDFDGVIVDSFRPAFEVMKMICPHLTEDLYRKLFEGNINDWKEPKNIHTEECRHDIDFFTEYIPRMKKEAKIVPGIIDAIMELEKNYTLIVVSSTISSPIQEFLEEHGLANHFAQVIGNDVHKSKVEKIKMVFQKYEVKPEQCLFITDTLGDMKEASSVGVNTIGVAWGFHDKKTLINGNPLSIVENTKDLPNAIINYFEKSPDRDV